MIWLEKEDIGHLTLKQFMVQYDAGVRTGDYSKKEFAKFYGFKTSEISNLVSCINKNNEEGATNIIDKVNKRWLMTI